MHHWIFDHKHHFSQLYCITGYSIIYSTCSNYTESAIVNGLIREPDTFCPIENYFLSALNHAGIIRSSVPERHSPLADLLAQCVLVCVPQIGHQFASFHAFTSKLTV
mmetsp:Transcript_24165/g.51238  ORF Transcript_24165/g.51238 Transcript_24165/m.51238 type:complete len:107 (+) Transcript_24165:161-481(+)